LFFLHLLKNFTFEKELKILVIHPAESIGFISGEKEKEKNEKSKKKEKERKKRKR
jgi:hypothetical protein